MRSSRLGCLPQRLVGARLVDHPAQAVGDELEMVGRLGGEEQALAGVAFRLGGQLALRQLLHGLEVIGQTQRAADVLAALPRLDR